MFPPASSSVTIGSPRESRHVIASSRMSSTATVGIVRVNDVVRVPLLPTPVTGYVIDIEPLVRRRHGRHRLDDDHVSTRA